MPFPEKESCHGIGDRDKQGNDAGRGVAPGRLEDRYGKCAV